MKTGSTNRKAIPLVALPAEDNEAQAIQQPRDDGVQGGAEKQDSGFVLVLIMIDSSILHDLIKYLNCRFATTTASSTGFSSLSLER